MEQTFKYRAYLTDEIAREVVRKSKIFVMTRDFVSRTTRRHINICREVYNHALGLYNAAPDGDKPTYNHLQNQLPSWKRKWNTWASVNAKCLQMAVRRIFNSLSVLKSLKSKGYKVGKLKWKTPREYRSIVFNQSGFDVDSNTGRTDHATLELSKLCDDDEVIDLDYHHQKSPISG